MLADRLGRAVERLLLVYAKPPVPGRVKTRLIGALGAGRAAELQEALLRDLLEGLHGGSFEVELRWALAAGEEPPDLGLPWAAQEGAGLGERLWSGLAAAAAPGRLVGAVGGDLPDLPRARVEEAFRRLEREADLVLGPSADGGYYLVAARPAAVRRELFAGIPWSTTEVYSMTVARCRELGLRLASLPEAADVDTPADLAQLAQRLSATGAPAPRTRALLTGWGWGDAA